jgi:predicted metal-dependent hydrolase
MAETIRLGDIVIALTRKTVKHVHLSVYPPTGQVTLVAPMATRVEVARAYAASRLGWIRAQQAKLQGQAREAPRQFVERESHYLWGRRYLLTVREEDAKPSVSLTHRKIQLTVRPGSDPERRAAVMHEWHKWLLHAAVPELIKKWEPKLGVKVAGYFLQRMKTRWGGCNPGKGNIRLNTELVKKPRDLLEYVLVHEMAHLVVPGHDAAFTTLLDRHWPQWRESRAELNELPLASETWQAGLAVRTD